jgi:hypothetical protein
MPIKIKNAKKKGQKCWFKKKILGETLTSRLQAEHYST